MALIRSTVLSSIRGSINGTTYSQNRYGAYARNRTVPVNPRTTAQQFIRASLTASSQAWRALTDAQRTLWTNYASATPVLNRLGETITLSGQAMFNKYQTWYRYQSLTPPTIPPLSPGLAETLFEPPVSIEDSTSAAPNVVIITGWINGGTAAGDIYPAWISAPQSAGTIFFKGPWHFIGTHTGLTRDTAYNIPFTVTAGQFFFVRLGYRNALLKLANDTITARTIAVSNP